MRIKATIEYDGSAFCGWQAQEGLRTIEGELESALKKITVQNIVVFGSGRTDAGVSAKNQVAHFDFDKELPPTKIAYAMNMYLPPEIRVKKTERVCNDFHARYDVKSKTYCYKMYASSIESPLRDATHLQVWPNLDFDAMIECTKHFVGTHDFKAFCQENPQLSTTVRTITHCEMTKIDDEITITVTGSGFLHNMVRIICGTILKVGQRKLDKDSIPDIIASRDRARAGQTLPAKGLTLDHVDYE